LPEPVFKEITGGLVVTFGKSKYTEEYLGKLGLNERQSKAVEYLRESKRITRQEYAFLFECSVRTAFNDLQGMIDKQILQRRGKGRYTYYELA